MEIAWKLGCAVFIETSPDGEIPADVAKGVRKTWLEGYSPVKELVPTIQHCLPNPTTAVRYTESNGTPRRKWNSKNKFLE